MSKDCHELGSCRNDGLRLRTFIKGTIGGVITAPDARAGASRLNKFDVVFVSAMEWISQMEERVPEMPDVPKTFAAFRVTPSASSTAGIVLSTTIIGVKTAKELRANASCD